MPSEAHDQRRLPAMSASFEHDPFSEARRSHGQKEIGFWKSESNPDRDGMARAIVSRNKPLTNFQLMPIDSHQSLAPQQSYYIREQNGIHGLQQLMGSEKKPVSTWKSTDFNFDFLFNLQSKPLNGKQNGSVDPGVLHENSLFSNSLPETFSQKVTSSSKNVLSHQQTDELQSNLNEDGPFESLQEMEARTIGNLLPDDDDLFSRVEEFEGVPRPTNLDEDDIFGSLGGMELEIDDGSSSDRGSKNTNMNCKGESTGANGAYFGHHPHGERPSRILFVRNIDSGVEDDELRSLFERYGDVQMMYTACKHRGFVMISYYDIRSASNAMKQLQNKLLRHRKLDIHYSIPRDNLSEKDINQGAIAVSNLESSVSNDELRHIFGVYGEIKEIWESPHKDHKKILEFYDSRVAEVTLRALDGKIIAGKQIKLEPSCPQFTTYCGLMQQFTSDIEQGEADIRQRGSGPDSSAVRLGTTPVQMNASIGSDNIPLQGPYPVPQGPINSIFDSLSNGLPSSFPHLLSSPIPSVGNLDNQSGIAGIEGALGSMNLSYQRMPNIHSHSLPERQNNFAMGILQNSPGIMQGMDANIGRRPEGIDGRHVNSSLPYDHGGAFGTPGSAGCPLHGHQYLRNRFPSYNPPHLGHVMWQNSPTFFNSIAARSPTQMQGFPRTSSHMPNNMAPFPHHVGSAPTTNAALWDRRHGYAGDMMDGSAFHPSSLGSMGFSASPTLHQMDLASRNIYPFGDGSCMESPLPSSHIGIPSPQNCQMFGGQNSMIHFNSRYDAPNDRMRNRRSDSTANQGDNKKQFELDIERIVRGEDNRTTLMIKNIPNKYTSKMLLATIDEHHRGTYDFIYLPIDFKNKCNVGYAFINLIDPKKIIPFYETFNGKKWEKFNSEKVASLAYARIQGKSALVAHFQNSSLMNEDKRCRPILFHSDGPNAGDQEPFPMGSNIRSRTGRPRIHNNDEDQQGSLPSAFGGEETSNEFNSPPRSKKSDES